MHEIEAIVSGKVQMVGFREFVLRHARSLWLQGFVENIGQGELKVVAQGPEEKLKRLIEYLHKGPFLAKVRDVVVVWREPTGHFTEFSIL
jgi:acylphosphatase